MIRLGLRLLVTGGKEAAVRLVATTVGVAIGVGLLLTTLAAFNGVNSQNARYAWLMSGSDGAQATGDADPLWWRLKSDFFDGESIGRIDVAPTGPDAPVPPGLGELPGPGELVVSPALRDLLASTPAAELGDRFRGRQVGILGDEALPGPDSLIVVIGHTSEEMAETPGATKITAISTMSPSSCSGDCLPIGIDATAMNVLLAVVAAALVFPVAIFIATATRLAAARREQRFAAMRLVGATPRQVTVISAIESMVVGLAGAAGAFAVFALIRGPVAGIPFTGAKFFTGDLSLRPLQILLVVFGVPLVAAVASRIALRRVQISPLGVSRRVTPAAPSAWRLLPLVAGLGELVAVVVVGRPDGSSTQITVYFIGFVLILVGLMLAGPWLTMVGARLVAYRTSRPAALLAGQRLADNPKAGFRAVSGLVLALFIASVAVGTMTTFVAERTTPDSGDDGRSTLTLEPIEFGEPLAPLPDATRSRLTSIEGVTGVATVHADPQRRDLTVGDGWLTPAALVACADLARTPALGRCAPGVDVATIPAFLGGPWEPEDAATGWPDAGLTPDELGDLPINALAVATDGSRSAIEEARTVLEAGYPDAHRAATIDEFEVESTRVMRSWQQLANVVVALSLVVAGCSLAVSVAAGLIDRKRPFSLLRLTGVPLGVLRRVVALESALPLLLVAAVSTASGFVAAHLFLRVQLGYDLQAPGAGYYAGVLGGLVVSLAIIASTMPLLDRITGPETARNE